MSKKVFMYGSCVSRDCLPFLEERGVELSRYVARQSVISAMAGDSGKLINVGPVSMESEFQTRSLVGDLSGNLLEIMTDALAESQYILMDLIDERGGVWVDTTGAVVTNSLELTKSGILGSWDNGRRHIKFGTDEHFSLWTASIDKLASELSPYLQRVEVYVVQTAWAAESIEGDVFPFNDSKLDPGHMNGLYARYYDYIDTASPFCLLVVPKTLCLTTRRHQWGIAPYHYVPESYEYIATAVSQSDEAKHVD